MSMQLGIQLSVLIISFVEASREIFCKAFDGEEFSTIVQAQGALKAFEALNKVGMFDVAVYWCVDGSEEDAKLFVATIRANACYKPMKLVIIGPPSMMPFWEESWDVYYIEEPMTAGKLPQAFVHFGLRRAHC